MKLDSRRTTTNGILYGHGKLNHIEAVVHVFVAVWGCVHIDIENLDEEWIHTFYSFSGLTYF